MECQNTSVYSWPLSSQANRGLLCCVDTYLTLAPCSGSAKMCHTVHCTSVHLPSLQSSLNKLKAPPTTCIIWRRREWGIHSSILGRPHSLTVGPGHVGEEWLKNRRFLYMVLTMAQEAQMLLSVPLWLQWQDSTWHCKGNTSVSHLCDMYGYCFHI